MTDRFSNAMARAMRPLRRRLGMSPELAAEDDPFSERFNYRACDLHLSDLRAVHGASLWPSVPEHLLPRGDGDRAGPLTSAAQSLLPSFAGLCAEGGAA